MAQSARDSKLENRSSRLKLPAGRRYFRAIGEGLTLVYRRTSNRYGTWSAKIVRPDGKYSMRALAAADDQQEANGHDVLTFWQAQNLAKTLADRAKANAGIVIKPHTVGEAATRYLEWFREHRQSVRETEHTIKSHIVPALGDTLLDDLTTAQIRQWLDKLATQPARLRSSKVGGQQKFKPSPKTAEQRRARRATANRILSVLKAILNRAFERDLVGSDTAWRKVKPFRKVEEARIRFLTDAEAVRLVNACSPDLRQVVRAALLCGARYGELIAMCARDVNLQTAQVYVTPSKSGRARYIPLNAEGVAFFRSLVTGKLGDAALLEKSDGTRWGKNHHVRPLAEACKRAKITPGVAFHQLRHTYASHLAQAGVDLLTISKLLGHADTRITSKHYAHLADKTLSAAVEKLPDFGGGMARHIAPVSPDIKDTGRAA